MPATSAFYMWKPPGKAISVHFDLAVLDTLRAAVLKAPHSEAERRDEIGGLLLGRVEPGQNIIVDGFELLASEHRRGPSFILSARDGEKLGTRLQWWSEHHNEREPIGFFRSHTRSGLYLDRNDQEVISRFFAKPSDVALLIRPAADGDCMGGCFFWEDVSVQGTQTYLEFPFDSRRLASQSYVPEVIHEVIQQPKRWPVFPVRQRSAPIPVAAAVLALLLLPLLALYAYRLNSTHLHAPPVQSNLTVPAQARQKLALAPRVTAEGDDSIEGLPVIEERVKLTPAKSQSDRQIAGNSPHSTFSGASVSPHDGRQWVTMDAPRAAPVLPTPPTLEEKPAVQLAMAPALPTAAKIQAARAQSATVVLVPVTESAVRRAVSHLPLVSALQRHRFKSGDRFTPATPLREIAPTVPRELRSKIAGSAPIDLRITIDKTGSVAETELLSKKADSALAELAVRAASQWDFTPARINSRAVTSDMLVHMRFGEQTRP